MNDTQWHVEIGSVGQVNSITAFCSQPHLASFFKRTGLPRTCRQSPNTAYWNFRHQNLDFNLQNKEFIHIGTDCHICITDIALVVGKVEIGWQDFFIFLFSSCPSSGKGSGGVTRSGLSSQIQEPIIAQPFVEPTAWSGNVNNHKHRPHSHPQPK